MGARKESRNGNAILLDLWSTATAAERRSSGRMPEVREPVLPAPTVTAGAAVPGSDQGQAQMRMTGRSLGHYELGSVLGSGGMGVVYLGHDSLLQPQVATKVLPVA